MSIIIKEDVNSWSKIGRGRTFSFYATLAEIQQCIDAVVAEESGQYCMVSERLLQPIGRYVPRETVFFNVSEFDRTMIAPDMDGNAWLIPGLYCGHEGLLDPGMFYLRCSLSGFPTATVGYNAASRIVHDSMFSVVDRVRNEHTGEIREYEESLRVYRRLVKEMQQLLRFQTIRTARNGSEYVGQELMTQGAGNLLRGGVSFDVKIGPPI